MNKELEVKFEKFRSLFKTVIDLYYSNSCQCAYPRYQQILSINCSETGNSFKCYDTELFIDLSRPYFDIKDSLLQDENKNEVWTCKKCGSLYEYGGTTNSAGTYSVIVLDPTCTPSAVDNSTCDACKNENSPGEISAHELLGHQLGNDKNSIYSKGLDALQAGNLYLRSQGITDFYRENHKSDLYYDKNKVQDIPSYIK